MTLQFTAYVCHFSDVIHSTHSTLHPSQIPSKDTAGSNPTSSRQNSSQVQQTHFDDRGCCYRGPLHDRWFLCLQERGDQGCHVLHHRCLFSFVRRISDLQAPHELNRFIFFISSTRDPSSCTPLPGGSRSSCSSRALRCLR